MGHSLLLNQCMPKRLGTRGSTPAIMLCWEGGQAEAPGNGR